MMQTYPQVIKVRRGGDPSPGLRSREHAPPAARADAATITYLLTSS